MRTCLSILIRHSAVYLFLALFASNGSALAAESLLPALDLSSGVPFTVDIRRQLIKTEISLLGDEHPWAGHYTFGDGLGVNQELFIAPHSGFVVTWRGCMGLYGVNEGQVIQNLDGDLTLDFLWRNRAGGMGGFPPILSSIGWGERRLLIPPEQMIDFVSIILETSVGRGGVCGSGGAGQGAMRRNSSSIQTSCNAAMRRPNRAICPVARSPNG